MNTFVRSIATCTTAWRQRGAVALALAGLLLPRAEAATPRTDLLSGPGWQASANGIDGWIPAYAPFPNPVTMPNPALNPQGVYAELMWYWPGPGTPGPGSGPTTAYFRHPLDLPAGPVPQIVALVAADDELTLQVNGVTIGGYVLDDHKMSNGQPEVVAMDLTPALHAGANRIDIKAVDTRGYHWLFFDSYNLAADPRNVLVARTPDTTSLVGDKDDFHGGDAADAAPRSDHVLAMQRNLVAAPAVDLDQPAVNQSAGLTHFLTLPANAIVTSATVKLRVKMTGDLVQNDVILYNQSEVPAAGEASTVIALHDLLGFAPKPGAVYELAWNLAKTPLRNFSSPAPFSGQPDRVADLLSMLKNDRRLDVLAVDDTMVDYSELNLTYTVAGAAVGDLNNDGAIDRDDLTILLLSLNTAASGPDDPRDLDRDGRITVLDVRKLVDSCTRPLCAK
ncbi:hypothetical protein GTP91_29330 [Rugamonas sp. FT82W]|uniref:Dockerin domain-containing protein n=1 Tax=Duganella vulcania TaxID=2692166 RepID=A0A845GD04_9BURK|nr:hypothetical protein [Duganella vulcania]MYM91265.1 hypothetical protein [Duganella vulcania]